MARRFDPNKHIQSLLGRDPVEMYDDNHQRLSDIRGVGGAGGVTADGVALGVDRIIMWPGSAFPLHTHEGHHLLYVLSGAGGLHVDGIDYVLTSGDSIYVPADYPHGVIGPQEGAPLIILAFGIPHHPIESSTRMRVVASFAAEVGGQLL
jgi:quercetin dioxygenase-like cupin family protein